MDKTESYSTLGHTITISERKSVVISGIKKIESFDNEEFLMETNMGYIILKGADLEIIKLDTYQGTVSIKGKVNSMTYVENLNKKTKEDSVFNKLFK
jgi:sporulation protein YabP